MSSRRKKQSPAHVAAAAASSQDRATLSHLVLLSAISMALYAPALWNGFVLDDGQEVLKDRLIRTFANIPALFAHNVWFFEGEKIDNYYRPLKLLAYTIEYHLFGFHPALWHLANVLLNCAVVLAVYLLVRAMASTSVGGVPIGTEASAPNAGLPLAFWSALFFAFHPIHVEAVAWIAAGNDLLCGLALLLALWFYHRARVSSGTGGPREAQAGMPAPPAPRGGGTAAAKAGPYSASVALFFAGLLFKETALTFPGIIVSYDFFYRGETIGEVVRGWRRYAVYVTALGGYLVLRVHALRGFAPKSNPVSMTFKDMVLSVPVLAVQYLWKALVPISLKYWYVYEPVRALGWRPVGAITLVLVLVLGVFWLRPRQPVLSLALAWFWLALIPVLDIPKVGKDVFNERYLYIPSFGFCLIVAWAWSWLWERAHAKGKAGRRAARHSPRLAGGEQTAARLAHACLLALLISYTAIIFRRIPDWHDSLRLVTSTAQHSPGSGIVQGMVGAVYLDRGSYQEAFGYFQRAVALEPTDPFARNNLGSVLLVLGHPDRAVPEFQKAIDLDPTLYPFWSNLCLTYTRQKEWGKAAEACGRAVQLDAREFNAPKFDTRINLAISLVHLGQLDAAAAQLVAGLRAEPDSPDAYLGHYELGVIYQDKGLWQEAAQQYQQALSQNPRYVPARTQLEAVRAHLRNP